MIPMQGSWCVVIFGLLCIVNLSTGQTCSNGTNTGSGNCAPVPNVIPTPNTYNIGQLLTTGPWYGYLRYNSDSTAAPPDVNLVNFFTSLGRSVEPTRSQPSEVIIQEKRRYINGSCSFMLEICQFTTDGRQFGPFFDRISAQGVIGETDYDASIIWSTDQSTYIMFFWCSKHNWQSGACASSHIYVYTRTRPPAMTASQRQVISSAVDAVLQPYCINSSQFAQYQYDNSLPDCPQAPWPDCFSRLVTGYTKLVAQ